MSIPLTVVRKRKRRVDDSQFVNETLPPIVVLKDSDQRLPMTLDFDQQPFEWQSPTFSPLPSPRGFPLGFPDDLFSENIGQPECLNRTCLTPDRLAPCAPSTPSFLDMPPLELSFATVPTNEVVNLPVNLPVTIPTPPPPTLPPLSEEMKMFHVQLVEALFFLCQDDKLRALQLFNKCRFASEPNHTLLDRILQGNFQQPEPPTIVELPSQLSFHMSFELLPNNVLTEDDDKNPPSWDWNSMSPLCTVYYFACIKNHQPLEFGPWQFQFVLVCILRGFSKLSQDAFAFLDNISDLNKCLTRYCFAGGLFRSQLKVCLTFTTLANVFRLLRKIIGQATDWVAFFEHHDNYLEFMEQARSTSDWCRFALPQQISFPTLTLNDFKIHKVEEFIFHKIVSTTPTHVSFLYRGRASVVKVKRASLEGTPYGEKVEEFERQQQIERESDILN